MQTNNNFKPGERIRFAEEKQAYTIKASDARFMICTKPFNAKKTVLYTIVDLQRNERGTEDFIFCRGFETDVLCNEALERLQAGESKVSQRNCIPLNITSAIND